MLWSKVCLYTFSLTKRNKKKHILQIWITRFRFSGKSQKYYKKTSHFVADRQLNSVNAISSIGLSPKFHVRVINRNAEQPFWLFKQPVGLLFQANLIDICKCFPLTGSTAKYDAAPQPSLGQQNQLNLTNTRDFLTKTPICCRRRRCPNDSSHTYTNELCAFSWPKPPTCLPKSYVLHSVCMCVCIYINYLIKRLCKARARTLVVNE